MSKIRIDPLVSTVRFYDREVDETLPLLEDGYGYTNSLLLTHMDDGSVKINLSTKAPSISEALALKRKLKSLGIRKTTQTRKGKETIINL
jgi:hypothetical protein